MTGRAVFSFFGSPSRLLDASTLCCCCEVIAGPENRTDEGDSDVLCESHKVRDSSTKRSDQLVKDQQKSPRGNQAHKRRQ
jgi:hypothetical protein